MQCVVAPFRFTILCLCLTAIHAATGNPPPSDPLRRCPILFSNVPAGGLRVQDLGRHRRARRVSIASFRMSVTEITRAQFAEFLRDEARPPIRTALKRCGLPADASGVLTRPDHPATHVTLDDARAYCRWLTTRLGGTVTLPTEREWEYAARAGLHDAPYAWGWGDPTGRAQWNADAPEVVARYPPNAFGLHDMTGNVYEWCEPSDPVPDGLGVLRGGAWSEKAMESLRVDHRVFQPLDYADADAGFRVVLREDPRGSAAASP